MPAARERLAHAALMVRLVLSEWRHHPARLAMALLAIALGVALAFAVHLINASALAEFGAAVRSVNGQPDLSVRAGPEGLDEALYGTLATDARVAWASPVLEIDSYLLRPDAAARGTLSAEDDADAARPVSARVAVRVLGLDAFAAPVLAPGLLPRPDPGQDGLSVVDPDRVFVNAAARAALGPAATEVMLQWGTGVQRLPIAGSVAAEGGPMVVMDLAGAQARFGRLGRLSRVDLRVAEGLAPATVAATLAPRLGPGVRVAAPDEAQQRVSNLSRAYRVNLTVLALVALFTGGFLVFSVQSLAVAKRVPQLALLGVLGLHARQRLGLVMLEAAGLGVGGALLGLALGTGLAVAALRLLGGDLGSGLVGGGQPVLQWSGGAALLYGGLGVAAALAGSAWPARQAAHLPPAQSLKGLGSDALRRAPAWLAPALLAAGTAAAFAPPVMGLPLAAYAAVALLLLGGIAVVPLLVRLLLGRLPRPRAAVPLLALERARDQRDSATVAVAGVVASLALSVALTVMVDSFRGAVADWLDQVLPADLYARTATSAGAADGAFLSPAFVEAAARVPGVLRTEALRAVPLGFDPALPAVTLIARPLVPAPGARADDAPAAVPLVGELRPPHPTLPTVYASEGFVALHGGGPGTVLRLPGAGRGAEVFVRGVWRDYARQQGSLLIDREDWRRLSGDTRANDLALWLAPGTSPETVQAALRALAEDPALLEFGTPAAIRAASLRLFDRSFAVTTWLQAVAIAIGLAGIAASFSAQVLARRREFGALQHLGVTRRQVLALVALEGGTWTAVGTVAGLALGIAVAAVLVHVVNPQSFHWTMDLRLPLDRLAALAAAVLAAGMLTAFVAGRAAASRDMALAVKEDW